MSLDTALHLRAGSVDLQDARDPLRCGSKAATLGRLLRAGHDVPAGVVLTADVHAAELAGRLEPEALTALLAGARGRLGPGPLIVRSSAVGEDGAQASFAGQLLSVPDVNDDLELAVRRVWASADAPGCRDYQRTRGVSLGGVAVLIQRQVEAVAAGVLFTHSPDDPRAALIEYCAGRSEDLVAGRIDPGRVRVAADGSWTREANAPNADVVLDEETVRELTRQGRALVALLGGPQDVEFTVDAAGRVQIVQARAVTAAPTESWTNANLVENFPDPVTPLLASIAKDGYTALFTNLGEALGIRPWRLQAMQPALARIVGTHAGRLYYNLTSIHAVLRLVPGGEFLTGAFNSYTGAEERTQARPEAASWEGRARVGRALEIGAVALSTVRHLARLGARARAFERTADAFAARTSQANLEDRDLPELGADLRAFLDVRVRHWTPASLVDAATTVTQALTRRLLRVARPESGDEDLGRLLEGLPDLVSTQPTSELWRLSRRIRGDEGARRLFCEAEPRDVVDALRTDPALAPFAAAFDAYLEQWGFRCSRELMLSARSFQDDPHTLVPILRNHVLLDAPASPDELRATRDHARRAHTRALLRDVAARRPLLAAGLGLSLLGTQGSIRLRERCRLKQALLYRRCRALALAIGERGVERGWFAEADDPFFLTHPELSALLAGNTPPDAERIRARRAEHARNQAAAPPPAFTLPAGASYPARPAAEVAAPSHEGDVLRGVGAAAGVAHGPAAVLDAVSEADRLSPGDVLVTGQTDPGWGPLFFLIRGLVLERGGLLSHGAILAREYGVPTVVGVANARRRIQHGNPLTVDGDAGEVHLG